MAYTVGIVLACCVSFFARWVGLDRDRAFYPTLLIVIASYYVLFALVGGSAYTLLAESMILMLFLLAAVVGFKLSLWIVVVALAGHGVFDVFHDGVVANPGVPPWWPSFCLAYDVSAAGCLGLLLKPWESSGLWNEWRQDGRT